MKKVYILFIALIIFIPTIFYRIFMYPLTNLEDFILFSLDSFAIAIAIYILHFNIKNNNYVENDMEK